MSVARFLPSLRVRAVAQALAPAALLIAAIAGGRVLAAGSGPAFTRPGR